MAISKKGKRTVLYQGKEYLWWVREDGDYCDAPWLTVASPDKSLILSYRVEGGDFFVVSKGRMFQGKETSGKKPVLRMLYLLVLCDEELSYDNYREEFCIGIFSSREEAEAVAKYYLGNVEGFKDYPCSYRIEEKKVLGEGDCRKEKDDGKEVCNKKESEGKRGAILDKIYMVYGWDENSEGDEINIVESDCFITELAAKQGMAVMKQMYERAEWCISRFRVNERKWEEGFVRV